MNCYGNLNKHLVGSEFFLLHSPSSCAGKRTKTQCYCSSVYETSLHGVTMFLSHTRTFRAFRNLALWYKVGNYVENF